MEIQEIKSHLKSIGMTYEELSSRSGIPLNTLKNIFRGKTRNPRIDTMRAIEDALELNQTTATITDNDKASDVEIQLSEKEQELLSLFRVLNSPMQDYVIQIIKAIPKTS